MKNLSLGILFYFFSLSCWGQSLQVTSHYPQTAFVIERLLPFSLTGGSKIQIASVVIEGHHNCTSFGDPFHSEIFHVFCRDPGNYDVVIRATNDGSREVLVINDLSIGKEREPAPEPQPVVDEATEGE